MEPKVLHRQEQIVQLIAELNRQRPVALPVQHPLEHNHLPIAEQVLRLPVGQAVPQIVEHHPQLQAEHHHLHHLEQTVLPILVHPVLQILQQVLLPVLEPTLPLLLEHNFLRLLEPITGQIAQHHPLLAVEFRVLFHLELRHPQTAEQVLQFPAERHLRQILLNLKTQQFLAESLYSI